jgi:hypothetical protein
MTSRSGDDNAWTPVASGNPRSGATALGGENAPRQGAENVTQLREGIEQTRRELGDTVDALVAKTDVKGRAQERARQARTDAQERLKVVRDKAGELGVHAREIAIAPEHAAKVRGGGLAAVGLAAAGAAVWAWRRRRRRPRTPWEKAVWTVRRAVDDARGPVGQAVEKAMTSEVAVRTVERARQAAAAPEARPRAEGAGAALGTLLVLTILRRAARRMPDQR